MYRFIDEPLPKKKVGNISFNSSYQGDLHIACGYQDIQRIAQGIVITMKKQEVIELIKHLVSVYCINAVIKDPGDEGQTKKPLGKKNKEK